MPVNSTQLEYDANAAVGLRARAGLAGAARMGNSFLPARCGRSREQRRGPHAALRRPRQPHRKIHITSSCHQSSCLLPHSIFLSSSLAEATVRTQQSIRRDLCLARQRTFIFLPLIFLPCVRVLHHSALPILRSPLSRRSGSEGGSPARAQKLVSKRDKKCQIVPNRAKPPPANPFSPGSSMTDDPRKSI